MNVLYLSYWGLDDGLTHASVLPHLKILSELEQVSLIVFVTIERNGTPKTKIKTPKTEHVELVSKRVPSRILAKALDFYFFPAHLKLLIKTKKIDHLMCRTALAGSLGLIATRKLQIPLTVESFEPHADYMLDAKVWSKYGIMYQVQKKWEKQIVRYASNIITVNRQFSELLKKSNTTANISTFPCAVDHVKFEFNKNKRQGIRAKSGFSDNDLIAIYVGKFGGVYLKKEAFKIFRSAYDYFGPSFKLILLTPHDKHEIQMALQQVNFPLTNVVISLVSHDAVPAYLSASDFAFSMIRPSEIRKYCSPIKNGEYWANGLPIVSPPCIGEDSGLIENENSGAIINLDSENYQNAFIKIHGMLGHIENGKWRLSHIKDMAKKHRSFASLSDLYVSILNT